LNPKTKILLQAHGIEVWGKQSLIKKLFLKNADLVLPVSQFTKANLLKHQGLENEKCMIFHNSLDPYFNTDKNIVIENTLIERHQLNAKDFILVTLTRLVSTEKYKGYDKVIAALAQIKITNPNFKYLILGKYDDSEYRRVTALIAKLDLSQQIILCGYIADEEISSYFNLANLFVMPSQKEGFGIVFIEAMACGLPVVAGNVDGSVDALMNGELGILIDPNQERELIEAITHYQSHPLSHQPELLKQLVNQNFGYPAYKNNLKKLLLN
jgi:glycosyltransferase involved in cell wall biosynthesis